MPEGSIGPHAGLFGSVFLDRHDVPQPLSLAIVLRFDLEKSELGLGDSAVLDRADQVAAVWPLAYQRMLLDVVQALAHAETLRVKWNPKVLRPRHERIFREVFKALELVEGVRTMFAPTSDGITQLLAGTMDFVVAAFDTMAVLHFEVADLYARGLLSHLRMQDQAKGVSNGLLAGLVALALGESGKGEFGESALRRRYLEERSSRRRKLSLATVDKMHWDLYRRLRRWSVEISLPESPRMRASISESIEAFLAG
jgi:hypothetical protein